MPITEQDLTHLRLAVSLAREAQEAGDSPFGSVLVSGTTGTVIATDRNRIVTGCDATLHPELTLARWAEANIPDPTERAAAVVYTSGEHCPMCAAAHAYCGLGRIVYVTSAAQFRSWMEEYGIPTGKVAPMPINQVVPSLLVEGPVEGLDAEVKALHVKRWEARSVSKQG